MAGCLEKWDIIPNVYIESDSYKNDNTAKRFDFRSGENWESNCSIIFC